MLLFRINFASVVNLILGAIAEACAYGNHLECRVSNHDEFDQQETRGKQRCLSDAR